MNRTNTNSCKKLLLFSVLAILATEGKAQTAALTVKCSLPTILGESSGIAITSRNSIWSHNDNSGNAELYNFDSTGTLLRTLKILNASNVDWEDLTKDTAGNFFIGDVGNNANTRQNLKIYRIPNPETIIGDSVAAQAISYSYPDQFAFPPPDTMKTFDSEAILAYNDSLYIFSKDWSDPFTGYTKLYRLPSTPGTYVAELIDSFYTGPGPAIFYSTTAAALSPDQSRMVLIGYTKLWLFTDYIGADFFSGACQVFDFSGLTQKEALCFISDDEVYITDEGAPGKLYYLDLQPYLPTTGIAEINPVKFILFPNPVTTELCIQGTLREPGNCIVNIINQSGQTIFTTPVNSVSGQVDVRINNTTFTGPGIYYVEVVQNHKTICLKRLITSF